MKHKRNRHSINALFLDLSVAAASLLCLTGCQEEFGGYFDQPGWVTSSSEDVLKSRGDCNTYLQLVGKTLFSKQIEGSGQYTFIVPTDEAFSAFFANNPYGYRSVDDIPEDVAARMVSSWMMYNSYPCDTLANVLQGFNTYSVNEAFKHQTPSYDVLREEVIDGEKCQVYDFAYTASNFSLKDNSLSWCNYRYMPIFTTRFNNNNSISSSDWVKVVGSEFSPYGNYVSAGIIDAGSGANNPGDLFCQNGVIHLVNKVVMPLENMDALIRTYGDGSAVDEPDEAKSGAWSLLRKLLYFKEGNGRYLFQDFQQSKVAKNYFSKIYPDLDFTNFYVRAYTTASPFLLNCEKYNTMALPLMNGSDLFYTENNGGMTFYVPQKDVLLNYINNRLFRYVGVSLDENSTQEEFNAAFGKLPSVVPVSLWASMQADGMIWPSQFESSAVNAIGSSEHINGYDNSLSYDNGVVAAGIASNGMWQITNFVPKTAAFEGVAARLLLDPAYSNEQDFITRNYPTTIYSNLLKSKLAGMDDVNLSLILWGDANAQWWDNIHYSTLLSAYATGELGNEESVNGSYSSIIRNGYIEREAVDALDLEVDPLNGAYGGWAYTNNSCGGVIRYRTSGRTINGQPEIQIQTQWTLMNDPQERTLWTGSGVYPSATLQTYEPTANCYTSVIKDNSADYVNGNVYLATEHTWPLYYGRYSNEGNTFGDGYTIYNSTMNTLNYLIAYLRADSASATPRHTLFKKYFDYYEANKAEKGNCDLIATGSGNWTVFVPTDEALQAAIDYAKTNDITLLRDPDKLPAKPRESEDANWVDSVICILSAYITKSGCFPDDGLSAIYETSEAWDGLSASNRQAPKQYLVTTIDKITDVDRYIDGKPQKPWAGLITGAMMSGYVAKTGDGNKLQYFGRPYTSGAFQVVDVYNSCDILPDKFDNTVVREAGQSNIMAYDGIIHSLNGFIIYKIASH